MNEAKINIFYKGKSLLEKTYNSFPISLGESADDNIQFPSLHYKLEGNILIEETKSGKFFLRVTEKDDYFSYKKQDKQAISLKTGTNKITIENFDIEITLKSKKRVSSKAETKVTEKKTGFYDHAVRSFIDKRSVKNVRSLSRNKICVKCLVSWKGDIIESRSFVENEPIYLGLDRDSIYLPTQKKTVAVGKLSRKKARFLLPSSVKITSLESQSGVFSFADLQREGRIHYFSRRTYLKIRNDEVLKVNFTKDIEGYFFLDKVPNPLYLKPLKSNEIILKNSALFSGVLHGFFLAFALIFGAKMAKAPKVKNMPDRVAKLLVQKPKKPEPPKPKPPEKKKPKKVVKKDPPKVKPKKKPKKIVKKQRKPKRVTFKKVKKRAKNVTKVSDKVSKVVSKTPSKSKPTPDIKQVGALAALGAISKNSPSTNQPVALNINPNAGGMVSKNNSAKSIIGLVKSQSGKLSARGMASANVKTKGKGFGSGSGYGVQGLKGRAGKRGGVAGVVVGQPKLMKISRTEGLTRKQVMAVVNKHLGKIQQCYEKALLTDPGIAGRVEYEWHITARGSVKWAKVKSSQVQGGSTLNKCVVKIFKSMDFPAAKNGESTVPSIGLPFGRM